MRVTSIATRASLNTRPDVSPRGETSTTTQSLNAPSRHSDSCAHTHSAFGSSRPRWLKRAAGCGERVLRALGRRRLAGGRGPRCAGAIVFFQPGVGVAQAVDFDAVPGAHVDFVRNHRQCGRRQLGGRRERAAVTHWDRRGDVPSTSTRAPRRPISPCPSPSSRKTTPASIIRRTRLCLARTHDSPGVVVACFDMPPMSRLSSRCRPKRR